MLKKYELEYPIDQKLEDMEVLKGVVNGKIDMSALDIDLKKRLISICSEQLDSVEKRIEEKRNNTESYGKFELNLGIKQGNYKISDRYVK